MYKKHKKNREDKSFVKFFKGMYVKKLCKFLFSFISPTVKVFNRIKWQCAKRIQAITLITK